MHDAPRKGRRTRRRSNKPEPRRVCLNPVRGKEREGGCGKWKEYEKGGGGAEFPKGRTKEGEVAGGRGDYLRQSKQDKLSVCISV